eukprot:m51a1_g2544 putative phosphatidylinositol 3-kinase (930) ;mRNA; f:279365-282611
MFKLLGYSGRSVDCVRVRFSDGHEESLERKLASASPVLAPFADENAQRAQRPVDAAAVSRRAWDSIVQYLQTADPPQAGTFEEFLELLVASNYLQLEALYARYRSILVRELQQASCPESARDRLSIRKTDFRLNHDESFFISAWPQQADTTTPAPSPVPAPEAQTPSPLPEPELCEGDSLGQSLASDPGEAAIDCEQSALMPPPADALSQRGCSPDPGLHMSVLGAPLEERTDVPEMIKQRRQMPHGDPGKCFTCEAALGMMPGYGYESCQHTCRACGHQFCAKHCSRFAGLAFEPVNTPAMPSMGTLIYSGGKQRVCESCYGCVSGSAHKMLLYDALCAASLPINLLRRAASLTPEWHASAKRLLRTLRSVQFRPSCHAVTELEAGMLRRNASSFAGHGPWLLQLILRTNWSRADSEESRQILEAVLAPASSGLACSDVMCTKACTRSGLRPCDAVVVLNERACKKVPDRVRQAAVRVLEETDSAELRCYLPQLVHYLRYEGLYCPAPISAATSVRGAALEDPVAPLASMLLRRALTDEALSHELYWWMMLYCEDPTHGGRYQALCQDHVAQLQAQFGPARTAPFSATHLLLDVLRRNANVKGPGSVQTMSESLNAVFEARPVLIPWNPSLRVHRVVSVSQFTESNSKPVRLALSCYNPALQTAPLAHARTPSFHAKHSPMRRDPHENVQEVLYKRCSVLQDAVVMKLVTLADMWLRRCCPPIELPIVTYNVVPVTPREGLIQLVGHVKPLSEIQGSIAKHVAAQNKQETMGEVVERRLGGSVAAWLVLVYIIGIGDRHLDNVLLLNDGRILNIDFEFICGRDPLWAPRARIPEELVDAKQLESVAHSTLLELRRYAVTIHNELSMLCEDDSVALGVLEAHIDAKLKPGRPDSEAWEGLKNFLYSGKLLDRVRDCLHECARYSKKLWS